MTGRGTYGVGSGGVESVGCRDIRTGAVCDGAVKGGYGFAGRIARTDKDSNKQILVFLSQSYTHRGTSFGRKKGNSFAGLALCRVCR